eukprot:g323.t1
MLRYGPPPGMEEEEADPRTSAKMGTDRMSSAPPPPGTPVSNDGKNVAAFYVGNYDQQLNRSPGGGEYSPRRNTVAAANIQANAAANASRAFVPRPSIANEFSRADLNKDGTLSIEEFQRWYAEKRGDTVASASSSSSSAARNETKHVQALPPAWIRNGIERPAGTRDMGGWSAAVYTTEQQARLGVNERGEKVAPPRPRASPPSGGGGNVRALPPAWIRNGLERPAGTRDMGGWVAAVYTAEQQARLGVNERGEKVAPPPPRASPPSGGGGNVRALPPAWIRNGLERPAGTRDMGGWSAAVYTTEQQARLGVNERGEKVAPPPPRASPPNGGGGNRPAGTRDMGGWVAAVYTAEQQARLGVNERGEKVAPPPPRASPPSGGGGNVRALPPAWIRNGLERPAGTRDMGGWVAAVYTAEQQARLGVNERGEMAGNATGEAGGAPSDAHWESQKRVLLDQIEKLNAEHLQLKESNDKMEAELLARMPRSGEVMGPLDMSKIQAEIQRLMTEKASLESRAAVARKEIEDARSEEESVMKNHRELLTGFKDLKSALDADDAQARAHLNQLLQQLKNQQRTLSAIRQIEDRRGADGSLKGVMPSFSQALKRATEEERLKTAETLAQVEQEAADKFEEAAIEAADRYADECDRVLDELKTEQLKQDALADELEKQVKSAEVKLRGLYQTRLSEYRKSAGALSRADPATVQKLRQLRTAVRKLWSDLNTDPERIIKFLESVRRVSPPDEKFYQLLCRTAEQLTAQLAIKQAIGQRDEMVYILRTVEEKCVETLNTSRTNQIPKQDLPPASLAVIPKIDRYLTRTLVKQLRKQYAHVLASLQSVDERLLGYLRDYATVFGEDYIHAGRAYMPMLRASMAGRDIASFDRHVPPGVSDGARA